MTGAPCFSPAGRAPASAPRPASGPPTSEPRRPPPSSPRRITPFRYGSNPPPPPLPPNRDYTAFLKRDGLKGARIGIPRAFYYDRYTPPGESAPRGGLTAEQSSVMADAIEVLRREGAVIVDPADIPSVIDPDPAQ